MEESTVSGGDSSTSRIPALMKYDDVVLKFADARLQYKSSILKYRDLIKEHELSTLKKLTYADVHHLVPDVEKNVIPQLMNQKSNEFTEKVELGEDYAQRNQIVRNELNIISKVLLHLEKEKDRLK